MYCAQCGQPVGARDRVCDGCQHDLLRSGAVRLTSDIPGPGQARPLPPDLWRQRPAGSSAIPATQPVPAGVFSDQAATRVLPPVRQSASSAAPVPSYSGQANSGQANSGQARVADQSQWTAVSSHGTGTPTVPLSPISAIRRQPAVGAPTSPFVDMSDSTSAITPIRVPAAFEQPRRRGLPRGAKVAIGLLVLIAAAAMLPSLAIKLNPYAGTNFNVSATPIPRPGSTTQPAKATQPAPTAPPATTQPAPKTTAAPPPATSQPATKQAVTFPAGSKVCRAGLAVGPNTSCEFAEAVAAKVSVTRTGTFNVSAVSPVTKKAYALQCTRAGDLITCRVGTGPAVYIAGS